MSIYGPVVSRGDVEQAYVNTLTAWLVPLLEEYERQHPPLRVGDIPRPGPVGIVGGVDIENFRQDNLPGVTIVCKPVDTTEIQGSGEIMQWYEATVSAIVEGDDELDARALADTYGAAVFTAISQRGSLLGFAVETRPERAADAEFIDPDKRRIMHADCLFRTLVTVADRRGGPAAVPPVGQEPADNPVATQVTATVIAEPLS